MKMLANVKNIAISGAEAGAILWGVQNVYATLYSVARNFAPSMIPQELLKPVVGVLGALALEQVWKGKMGGQVADFFIATAVADTISTAGNGGVAGAPGVIQAQVNGFMAPIAKIGAPAGTSAGTFRASNTRGSFRMNGPLAAAYM